jgi:hypothetical protein
MTDQDVQEIKSDLAEIKRMLRNAGLTHTAPEKVIDISKKAREIKERLDKRNGSPTNRA